MEFESSSRSGHDSEFEETKDLNKDKELRKIAEEQIPQAKNFDELNLVLHDVLGDVAIEGSDVGGPDNEFHIGYSGNELQARITDLRDAISEAQTPEDINKVEAILLGITRGLGLRDKVTELITPELNKKKGEIAGKEIG